MVEKNPVYPRACGLLSSPSSHLRYWFKLVYTSCYCSSQCCWYDVIFADGVAIRLGSDLAAPMGIRSFSLSIYSDQKVPFLPRPFFAKVFFVLANKENGWKKGLPWKFRGFRRRCLRFFWGSPCYTTTGRSRAIHTFGLFDFFVNDISCRSLFILFFSVSSRAYVLLHRSQVCNCLSENVVLAARVFPPTTWAGWIMKKSLRSGLWSPTPGTKHTHSISYPHLRASLFFQAPFVPTSQLSQQKKRD